jgi:hypothetical protein
MAIQLLQGNIAQCQDILLRRAVQKAKMLQQQLMRHT